jgi:hypothetical protein
MTRSRLIAFSIATVWIALLSHHASAQWAATKVVPEATHHCDDPTLGTDVIKSIEIADQKDGAPHQTGAPGNWFVTRMTKWIPYCIYHDGIGLYSLDTYALTPKFIPEEVQICEALPNGGSRPVQPFAGPCPPGGN